jgi:3-oxoacyl-(acyl-carrier-protein) synthase
MKAYIQGTGNISPQQTFNSEGFLSMPVEYQSSSLTCIEPDHSQWINPQQLRRMSRILKNGTSSAFIALKNAGITVPDSIITGTGYGCLEDTAVFLTKITELKETALNPTPFMQSTHNTIGSQIALLLQCQGYNQTYVHDAFSFEHALLDAMMQLEDVPEQHILAGGVDENTKTSHIIQSRFNLYRKDVLSSLEIIDKPGEGTLHGEGATWFVLTGNQNKNSKAVLKGMKTFFQPTEDELLNGMISFVNDSEIKANEVDLILVGKSGDKKSDQVIEKNIKSAFTESDTALYKHLCGEHCSASAFAMWVGVKILELQQVPSVLGSRKNHKMIRNVLIYNPYFCDHHSLILLSSCRDSNT